MTPPLDSNKSPALWPLALLGVLVSVMTLLVSKRDQSSEAVHPQDSTNAKHAQAQRQAAFSANIVPTPPNSSSAERSKKSTPLWEILAVLIAFGLLVVNICQMRSTDKAAAAAEGAVEQAEQTMRLDQRAWIHIGSVPPNKFKIGQPMDVPIMIGVVGKTPAKIVTGDLVVQLLKPNEIPDFLYDTPNHPHYHLTPLLIIPDTGMDITLTIARYALGTKKTEPIVYNPTIQRDLANGDLIVVIFADLTYDDVFGVHHWLKFCTYGAQNLHTPGPNKCNEYNDVDNNK
jgi:hypothetical protein